MKKIIAGSIIAITLGGCASMRQKRIDRICQTCHEKTRVDSVYSRIEKEVIRFDTIITPEDSAFYFAWLKCQDGSAPKMYRQRTKKGKRTSVTVSIDSTGKLTSKCNSDSLMQIIEGKDKYIQEIISKSETKTIVIDLTWWQKALMYFGGFSLIYFALRFAFRRFEASQNK
jgi:hypothetical protein